MIIDVHTHICALGRGGMTSEKLIRSPAFRFMRWRLGIRGERSTWPAQLEQAMLGTIDASGLDKAVILAFDAVYREDGTRDDANTHLFVENDYVAELAARHPKVLFGASIHPYRRDAVEELERCLKMGAVLVKWLPLTQIMNPADPRCFPFYDALAHYRIPLLCHTGGEQTLTAPDRTVRDPARLLPALQRGVTVVAAHCGTRSLWWEESYLETFCQMAKEHDRLYGDTAAITLPTRNYCLERILSDAQVRSKLVHGSDWPVIAWPPVRNLGPLRSWRLLREGNWMKRDILIKKQLRFDEAYWHRAAGILRLP